MFGTTECFNAKTFDLQCSFGDKVYAYKWKLIMGIGSNELKSDLIVYNNILQIILSWDPRDIGNVIPIHNTRSESQIHDLSHSLKSKLK
jgi:hypothetical protein|tara:strand:- start:414 stop:680 length:267 start_codon:yes stop_codon:yes gene_type:complete